MKEIKHFSAPTPGHLNNIFATVVGHLPVHFRKMLIPGGQPGGDGTAGID